MQRITTVAMIVLAIILGSTNVLADHKDQYCDTICGSYTLDNQIKWFEHIGMAFRPSEVTHTGVEIYIYDCNTGGTPEAIVVIREGIFGANVNGTEVTMTYSGDGWVRFNFPQPVDLVPGNQYTLDVTAPTSRGCWASTSGDCYGRGNGWIFGERAEQQEYTDDFWFRTYVVDVDGGCCFESGDCEVETPGDCAAAGGFYQGDNTDCDPNPCAQPGACCFVNGDCQVLPESDCTQAGGDSWYINEDCSPNPCAQPGACCFTDGSCQVLLDDDCSQAGGDYWLAEEECDPNPCDQPLPEGACCFPFGTCGILNVDRCLAAWGSYQGDATVCDPNPCPSSNGIDQACDEIHGVAAEAGILEYAPMGQTFIPSEATHLGIDLYVIDCNPEAGPPEVSIVLHEETIDGPVVPGSSVTESYADSGWVHFAFPDPVDLVPGLAYVIEVSAPSYRGCLYATEDDCYPDGSGFLVGEPIPLDYHFRTWVGEPVPEIRDDMETDNWTFGHDNPDYDGTWHAEYSADEAHSPTRSIRTSLHGGGMEGLDADLTYATRTFSAAEGYPVESMSVWYNSMGLTSDWVQVACYAQIQALSAAEDVLDSQIYCVFAFDDLGGYGDWENMDGWIYQEGRPEGYEPGAPDYSRQGDGSIQPPPGWWYELEVSPATDLEVDWGQVAYLKVDLVARGIFLWGNDVGMYWDDLRIIPGPELGDDWANHNVGNCILTVTDQGILGFMDDTQAEGAGFVYPAGGTNQLYVGSLWVGESEAYVANRDYGPEPVKEWVVSSVPAGYISTNESGWITGDGESDQDIHASYTDAGAAEPRELFVDQESWAFSAPDPADDLVIINYTIRNDGAAAMESLYVGCFLDVDIDGSFGDDIGSTDQSRALAHMTDACGTYVGVSLLQDTAGQEPALGNLTLISNGMCDPYYIYDETKYRLLSAAGPEYVLPDASSPGDYRLLASAGPIVLEAGEETLVAFAIIGGEGLSELQANADAASLIYRQGIADAPAPGLSTERSHLLPSKPNPFGQATVIQLELARSGPVTLGVYDLEGRLVRALADGPLSAKRYTLVWDGRDDGGREAANGVYFLRLETGQSRESQRLIRLK